FFFSSRRRHTRSYGDWSSDVCSSDLDLIDAYGPSPEFDILYLSYQEVRTRARKSDISDFVFRLYCGLWHLSGYVLTKKGAEKLRSEERRVGKECRSRRAWWQ